MTADEKKKNLHEQLFWRITDAFNDTLGDFESHKALSAKMDIIIEDIKENGCTGCAEDEIVRLCCEYEEIGMKLGYLTCYAVEKIIAGLTDAEII